MATIQHYTCMHECYLYLPVVSIESQREAGDGHPVGHLLLLELLLGPLNCSGGLHGVDPSDPSSALPLWYIIQRATYLHTYAY